MGRSEHDHLPLTVRGMRLGRFPTQAGTPWGDPRFAVPDGERDLVPLVHRRAEEAVAERGPPRQARLVSASGVSPAGGLLAANGGTRGRGLVGLVVVGGVEGVAGASAVRTAGLGDASGP